MMTETEISAQTANRSWTARLSRRGAFVLLVILPTLLVLLYQLLIASPQYESRTEYMIRGLQPEPRSSGGLAELLGGAPGASAREAGAIRDYLLSPDAIAALRSRGIDVATLYNRPDADILSRLRFDRPRAETLLNYYRNHVAVDFDKEAGTTKLGVRAFSPEDARKLAAALVALGEAQVNTFNKRAIETGIALAQQDLAKAEDDMLRIQGELTGFRDITRDLDPARNSEGEGQQLRALDAQLARERAALASMAQFLTSQSPQIAVQRSRVIALEAESAKLNARLTGAPGALSRRLAAYEQLKLSQDFSAKRYQAARASLDSAKEQAGRQQLFFVEVIKPNLPEKPDRPRPWRTALALLVGLSVAFSIGWLVLAGIREHEAV